MILWGTRRLERSGNELDRLAEVAGLLRPNALVQGPVGDASLKGLFVILLSLKFNRTMVMVVLMIHWRHRVDQLILRAY